MDTNRGARGLNLRIPKGFRRKAQGCEARATLGLSCPEGPTPKGLRHRRRMKGQNPVGVVAGCHSFSQGSSRLATLGWVTQSPWDWPSVLPKDDSSFVLIRVNSWLRTLDFDSSP